MFANHLHFPFQKKRITPLLVETFTKQYFRTHKNKPHHQKLFLLPWIKKCIHTAYGEAHAFSDIHSLADFQRLVPLNDYTSLEPRIKQAMQGAAHILTPWHTARFATSSGTTGASKYIPVTNKSLQANHFKAWREGFFHYLDQNPETTIFSGQNITIWGWFSKNPFTGAMNIWYISAILQKCSPLWARAMKQPKPPIAYLSDWETKMWKIIQTTKHKNITSFAGQPSRGTQFLTKVLEQTGAKALPEVRPHIQLILRWGMPIDLYRERFKTLFGEEYNKTVQYYQIYNASEGFFAMQHENNRDDMLLFLNHGVFYEFIPLNDYIHHTHHTSGKIDTIETVAVGVPYVIVITTYAGLRRYVLGDVVIFTGIDPHTVRIRGRTTYALDVAGECMPGHYIDDALQKTAQTYTIEINEYTVAPRMYNDNTWCYECIIGLGKEQYQQYKNNEHMYAPHIAQTRDADLQNARVYYKDERCDTKMLRNPIIHIMPEQVFYKRLENKGKLGWQHKVPKITHDQHMIDELLALATHE